MNDRIFGLAHQAGFNTLWNGAHIVFDVSTKENMKEFAELIVKECVTVLQAERRRLDALPDRQVSAQAIETAAALVKNHFGVEM
jgi:hypothetical protein